MHDLVIRGGTIVDGTGRERFEGELVMGNCGVGFAPVRPGRSERGAT